MGNFFSFLLIYVNVATLTVSSQSHFHKCFLRDVPLSQKDPVLHKNCFGASRFLTRIV